MDITGANLDLAFNRPDRRFDERPEREFPNLIGEGFSRAIHPGLP
jgi:hypothetical protein